MYIECCHAECHEVCSKCMTCNYHGLVQWLELLQKLPNSALQSICSLTSQLNNGSVNSVRLELNLITKPNFLILLLKEKRRSWTMCIQIIIIILPSWLGRACALGHASYSNPYLSVAKQWEHELAMMRIVEYVCIVASFPAGHHSTVAAHPVIFVTHWVNSPAVPAILFICSSFCIHKEGKEEKPCLNSNKLFLLLFAS